MCGITGFVALDGQCATPARAEAVRTIAAALAHRGPDCYGEHVAGSVCFAMRRLSIIDVAGGRQPLVNEDGSVTVVANGEIYNHAELRRELENLGHRFGSGSDCETIVHAYEQYGEKCVDKLRGMFAFALHDARKGLVLLARDRLGEKPLYVAEVSGGLFFGSELRALLAGGVVPTTFDPSSLFAFFHYGYIPEPHTAIMGIRKLPAGHCLSISCDDGRIRTWQYWSFAKLKPRLAEPGELAAAINEISHCITRSDVPVGVALSGGLDSGAIAVLAAAHSKERLHAFTVGYDEKTPSDETAQARRVAEHAGIVFHSVLLQTRDVVASYPETVWLKDDPNSDIAGPGYLAVMRAARDAGVPVLLVGQGGDELFWGYPWLVEAAHRTRARATSVPAVLRSWAAYAFDRRWTSQSVPRRLLSRIRQFATDAESLAKDLVSGASRPLFFDTLPGFNAARAAKENFFSPAFLGSVDRDRPFEPLDRPEIKHAAPEAALLQLICDTYLRENGLAQADRLAMSASVEVRVPFVDYQLAEIAYSHQLAAGSLIAGNKQLLREAFARVCPSWLLEQPKRGFTPPVASWNARIHRRYAPLLKDGLLVGLGVMSGDAAANIAAHNSARRVPQLHRDAVVLELWCRQIMAGAPLAASV